MGDHILMVSSFVTVISSLSNVLLFGPILLSGSCVKKTMFTVNSVAYSHCLHGFYLISDGFYPISARWEQFHTGFPSIFPSSQLRRASIWLKHEHVLQRGLAKMLIYTVPDRISAVVQISACFHGCFRPFSPFIAQNIIKRPKNTTPPLPPWIPKAKCRVFTPHYHPSVTKKECPYLDG